MKLAACVIAFLMLGCTPMPMARCYVMLHDPQTSWKQNIPVTDCDMVTGETAAGAPCACMP